MPPTGPAVLSEAVALEVLAYLITAARTQVDEAAEYGPMRLLTAAQRLAGHLEPYASPPVRELIVAVQSMPPTATPRDRDPYAAKLDEICVALAGCLLAVNPPAEAE
jgi:hypothetical protein